MSDWFQQDHQTGSKTCCSGWETLLKPSKVTAASVYDYGDEVREGNIVCVCEKVCVCVCVSMHQLQTCLCLMTVRAICVCVCVYVCQFPEQRTTWSPQFTSFNSLSGSYQLARGSGPTVHPPTSTHTHTHTHNLWNEKGKTQLSHWSTTWTRETEFNYLFSILFIWIETDLVYFPFFSLRFSLHPPLYSLFLFYFIVFTVWEV